MADYDLYYWSVPFRGQFVRAVLAYADQDWTEHGDESIEKLMSGPIRNMPVPFMGPPVLVERTANAAISQMPAILFYLGETLSLFPQSPVLRALTIKVINDANDVIDEITQDGGKQMWTVKRWDAFAPRLRKWMTLFEELGRRHGLGTDTGFLLGGDRPGIADLVTATLWSTMTERFPKVGTILKRTAPRIAALTARITSLPSLAALSATARKEYGDAYCGGQIEKSLRKVLNA